jgi:hypothetical protein
MRSGLETFSIDGDGLAGVEPEWSMPGKTSEEHSSVANVPTDSMGFTPVLPVQYRVKGAEAAP